MSSFHEFICEPGKLQAVQTLQHDIFMKDINQCIAVFKKTKGCKSHHMFANLITEGRYQLISVINKIKSQEAARYLSKKDLEQRQFLTAVDLEIERNRVVHLRKEWARQQHSLGRVQEALYRKCTLLSLHRNYCSTQGNSLCSPLAVLLEKRDVAEMFLAEPDTYLIGLVKIANGCLSSYGRTYAFDVPLEDSPDTCLILGLCTCLAHISTLASGRKFFIHTTECHDLLCEIIGNLLRLKHSSTEKIRFTLLKILHNILYQEGGSNCLWNCSELPEVAYKLLKQDYSEKHHKLILEILWRMTKDVPNEEFLNTFKNAVDLDFLMDFSQYNAVSDLPKRIFRNIENEEKRFARLKLQVKVEPIITPCPTIVKRLWSDDNLNKGTQCKRFASGTQCHPKIKQQSPQQSRSESLIWTSKPIDDTANVIHISPNEQLSKIKSNSSIKSVVNVSQIQAASKEALQNIECSISCTATTKPKKSISHETLTGLTKVSDSHTCTICTCGLKDKTSSLAKPENQKAITTGVKFVTRKRSSFHHKRKMPKWHKCKCSSNTKKDPQAIVSKPNSNVHVDCVETKTSSLEKIKILQSSEHTFYYRSKQLESGEITKSLVPWTGENNDIPVMEFKENGSGIIEKPFQATSVIKGNGTRQKFITRIKIRSFPLENATDVK